MYPNAHQDYELYKAGAGEAAIPFERWLADRAPWYEPSSEEDLAVEQMAANCERALKSATITGIAAELPYHRRITTMKTFTLDVTLLATFHVKSDSCKEAKDKLRNLLDGAEANFGMLDDEPVIETVSVEGDIDTSA
jgi:hypothetical protein